MKEPQVQENKKSFKYNKFHTEYTAYCLIQWIKFNATLAKDSHIDKPDHFQLMQ